MLYVSFVLVPQLHWHCDGAMAGLVTCFVPLVDVHRRNGPTELRPGSHAAGDVYAFGRWLDAGDPRVACVAPELRAGEVLLFDYRVSHRGRANRSDAPRPVMYIVYSVRPGVRDRHNFLAWWPAMRPQHAPAAPPQSGAEC